jgi:TonB family protein
MYSRCSAAFRQGAANPARARARRMAVAVAVSILAHALLMSSGGVGSPARRAAQTTKQALSVTFSATQPKASEQEAPFAREGERRPAGDGRGVQDPGQDSGRHDVQSIDRPVSAPRARPPVARKERPPRVSPQADRAVARSPSSPAQAPATASTARAHSPDATYYTIRELDIYPVPAEPLRLGNLADVVASGQHARAVVELHISETGAVDAAKVIEARPSGYFERELETTFLAVRFSPAMRDGRIVRSRILVRIE